MSIADEISKTIAEAPMLDADEEMLRTVNPDRGFETMVADPKYKSLITLLMELYERSQKKGWSTTRAAAAVLGTFEDIIRYSIRKAVSARLRDYGLNELAVLELVEKQKEIVDRTEKLKADLDQFEKKYQDELAEAAKQLEFEKYKYSLLYAADRWGTPKERETVGRIVGRIKPDISSRTPRSTQGRGRAAA